VSDLHIRERDQTDVDALGQVAQEQLGRFLRRGQARRLDVAHAHAERDVDRENDGRPRPRQRHHRRRARGGEEQQRKGDQKQRGRDVAAPQAPVGGGADDVEAAVAQRALAAEVQQPEIQEGQQRHRQHQPEQLRPEEAHGEGGSRATDRTPIGDREPPPLAAVPPFRRPYL